MKSLRFNSSPVAFSRVPAALPFGLLAVGLCLAGLFLTVLLMDPAVVLAQGAQPAAEPTTEGTLLRMGFMFVMVYMIFHFLVIKPQKAKLTEQQNLLNTLKRGEQVVTSGGMLAKVAGVEKEYVLLELAPNIRVKFEPGHISKRLDKAAESQG